MQEIGAKLLLLAVLLGIGGVCIVLAELLCRSLGLDREEPLDAHVASWDADAQAMYEDLAREMEREAAQIAKRCGAEP